MTKGLKKNAKKVTVSSAQQKSHECALVWSDKCAYCEVAFDELKRKLLSTAEPTEHSLNELRHKIEESLATLEGLVRLFHLI